MTKRKLFALDNHHPKQCILPLKKLINVKLWPEKSKIEIETRKVKKNFASTCAHSSIYESLHVSELKDFS